MSGAPRRTVSPSLRMWLAFLILIPTAIAAWYAGTTVAGEASNRSQAISASRLAVELSSLVRARAAVEDELVPSIAILLADAEKIPVARLDSVTGIDFLGELTQARRQLDLQPALMTTSTLEADYAKVVSMRKVLDGGPPSSVPVVSAYTTLASAIDDRWKVLFDSISRPAATARSSAALGSSYSAFSSGLQASATALGVLTAQRASDVGSLVFGLVFYQHQYEASLSELSANVGVHSGPAWQAFLHGPMTARFNGDLQNAVEVGNSRSQPNFPSTAHLVSIIQGVHGWLASMTKLVLATSVDLQAVTAGQASSATTTLVVESVVLLLLLVVVIAGVSRLSRVIRRPLAGIVSTALAVRSGEFDVPQLEESGPKELAIATGALNEMSATLSAVQSHALALAGGDFDDPVLASPLPGRTGLALQSALSQLQESVRTLDQQREMLRERASRDSLTGLLNRGAALDALERDIARIQRDGNSMALLFIDLDGLKSINDTFGHEGGDAAIRTVADVLRRTTRRSDIVARLGGDEFVVARLGSRDNSGPTHLGLRICREVEESVTMVGQRRVDVGCSIGIAMSDVSDSGVDSLIDRADQALYLAKAAGRGQVRWFDGAERDLPAPQGV